MFLRLFLFLATATAACTATTTPRPTASPAPALPSPTGATAATTMSELMLDLESHQLTLEAQLVGSPAGDLRQVTDAANAGAALVRHGYGKYEDKQVPGFARLARDAESWLLQIALEARQAHLDLAREVYRSGYHQHCTTCHDAHKRVHG